MNRTATARPQGGFNTGFGSFNEHLDENALQSAVQQKAMAQQSANSNGPQPTGVSARGSQQPRTLGSLPQELVQRPVQDVFAGLQSFTDINALLEITNPQDPNAPKKQALHQRMQRLNSEDQARVQQTFKKRMQEKQQAEQLRLQKEQQRKQAEQQSLAVPSSPQKGPVGPGSGKSRKQSAVAQLTQKRQSLGGPSDVS